MTELDKEGAAKVRVVESLRVFSRMHSELWDQLELLLALNVDDIGYEIVDTETLSGETKYFGKVTLWNYYVIRMRKMFDTREGAEEYLKEYIDYIKQEVAGKQGTGV